MWFFLRARLADQKAATAEVQVRVLRELHIYEQVYRPARSLKYLFGESWLLQATPLSDYLFYKYRIVNKNVDAAYNCLLR